MIMLNVSNRGLRLHQMLCLDATLIDALKLFRPIFNLTMCNLNVVYLYICWSSQWNRGLFLYITVTALTVLISFNTICTVYPKSRFSV